MKKILRASLILGIAASLFASCKSHEKCPAYGEIQKKKNYSAIRG